MENICIEGVDIASGAARFGGKTERYLKTLSLFPASIPEFGPFSSVLADPTAARAMAHALKGTAGNLSIMAVYESAMAFEQSILQGAPDEKLYNELITACDKAKTTLSDYFSGTAVTSEKELGSDSEFMELKNNLIEAVNSFEASSCEKAMEKLCAKKWNSDLDIDKLASFIDSYDYFSALEMLLM